MANEHYFSDSPAVAAKDKTIRVRLAGREVQVTTSTGIFSPDRIDPGTAVLLAEAPAPPETGDLLDLGCGWGPLALTLALEAPEATVWAVDVNERSLALVRRNADSLGLTNIHAVRPDQVPADISFTAIWSNPPIRIGKAALHDMLEQWIPRLVSGHSGWFVVQRNLGSDSLQRWLSERFSPDYAVAREATARGYRVLRVERTGAA